jgi:hypothetical protein
MSEDRVYLSESLKDRIDLSSDIFESKTGFQLSIDGNEISGVELLSMQFILRNLRGSRVRQLRSIEFSTSINSIQEIVQCDNNVSVLLQRGGNKVIHEIMSINEQSIVVDIGEITNDRVVVHAYLEV